MLNIGFWELFLIVVVGLIVIGPKQLPEVAKTVARAMRKIRKTTDELRDSAREVVHEVIPPEDLYGYGRDDDEDDKAKTVAPATPPPQLGASGGGGLGAEEAGSHGPVPTARKQNNGPDEGDSSLAS